MIKKALLLTTLLVTDLALFGAIVFYLPLPKEFELQSKIVSAVLAHWFLLGFWLSFGGTSAPWRQAIATTLLVIICALAAPLDAVPNLAAVRGLLILGVTWLFYAAMFFPRRLMGLRIGWTKRDHALHAPNQFGLSVLLVFMAILSVPLAFSRLAFGFDRQLAQHALFEIGILFAPACVIMLPFAIAIFATQKRLSKLSLSLLWVVAATFAIKHFHPSTAGGPILWESVITVLGLVILQVIVILLSLRLLGLHWLGNARNGAPSSPQSPSERATAH